MPYFFGAAQEGYQNAMNQIAAKQQRDQALQMQALKMKAMQQQIDKENQQQQLMQQAAEWQSQQGMQPQQTVPPGQPSQPMQQPMQQPIQPPPWQAAPSSAPQQTPAIPPAPTRKQTQVNDYGIPPELMQAQGALQNKAMQLSSSPDNPQVLYERLRQSGNPNWLAIYKQLEPEAVKRFSAQKQMFDVEKGMFDEQVKVWQDQNRARSEALRDKKLTAAIVSATRQGLSGMSEEDKDALARAYKNDPSVLSGMGWSKGEKAMVAARAAKMAESEGTNIATTHAEYKADTSAYTQINRDLSAIRPYKEMLDTNANIAKDLAKKIYMSSSRFGNKSLNWLRQNATDNPDVSEYLAQMRFVQTEAARVLANPRLVGQLTDTARKEMEEVVSGDMPLNSTIRVLERIQKDGDNRINAMEKQKERLAQQLGGKKQPGAVKDDPLGIR